MTKNITVLMGANGVNREYNEVEREANVGELVKVVGTMPPYYQSGDIGKFLGGYTRVDFTGQGNAEVYDDGKWSVTSYVVLEPTDIIHVDGIRYREEKREAKVGERILIVAAGVTGGLYDNGSVLTVKVAPNTLGFVYVNEHGLAVLYREYVVITPLTDSLTKSTEPATNNITVNLTINVAPSSPSEILKAIVDSVQAELVKCVGAPNDGETRDKMTEALINTGIDTTAAGRALQKMRDNTVERAKEDLVELRSDMSNVRNPRLRGRDDIYLLKGRLGMTADFIVNKEKRTVVCLLRGAVTPRIYARGIAECSPDDCFNVHIGKAIALRRALGLDVPTEYLTAPQPTEVRVGDVVKAIDGVHDGASGIVESVGDTSFINGANGLVFRNTEYEKLNGYSYCWTYLKNVKIIDDSNPQSAYVSEVTAVA
ncbi:hypothetical protein [Brevibacillus laterosporus]|uniref:hypothetical protein n=1 Tax=Brevibacillus laterosporus TaxID=1465 RepID=UPI0015E1F4A9|nr:hypothetical protein [Brevibacillus laterosporus]